jgi:hypothetical protein
MATTSRGTRELLPTGPTRGRLTDRGQSAPPSERTMMRWALGLAALALVVVGAILLLA